MLKCEALDHPYMNHHQSICRQAPTHRPHTSRDMEDTHEICQFTYDILALRERVSALQATGGGDSPEDIFGAPEIACVMDWR